MNIDLAFGEEAISQAYTEAALKREQAHTSLLGTISGLLIIFAVLLIPVMIAVIVVSWRWAL